jgi:hypothetical protein
MLELRVREIKVAGEKGRRAGPPGKTYEQLPVINSITMLDRVDDRGLREIRFS